MARPRMVPDPQNPAKKVEGEAIRIVSVQDLPSYLTLEDGTEMTYRTTVLEVVRVKDRWDDQDDPIYSTTANVAVSLSVPESLKRKR